MATVQKGNESCIQKQKEGEKNKKYIFSPSPFFK